MGADHLQERDINRIYLDSHRHPSSLPDSTAKHGFGSDGLKSLIRPTSHIRPDYGNASYKKIKTLRVNEDYPETETSLR